MKKLLSSIIILLALCLTCPQVYSGGTTTQTVQLNKKPKQVIHHRGSRIPAGIVVCIISTEGIQMDFEPNDILSYEIWNSDGEICVASYTEEADFINALFSMEGEYQIHFSTEEYSYIGYVTI